MNGKQAKKLRRLAEKVSVGAPEKNYFATVHRRAVMTEKGPVMVNRRTVRHTECMRSIYQSMKEKFRNGINPELMRA